MTEQRIKTKYLTKIKEKFKDEIEIVFCTSLGAVLGETLMHKGDLEYIKTFGENSKYTYIMIDGKLIGR